MTSQERVVLITGCSAGGIGYHMALEFAAHGCRVFAGVRTLSKAQTLASNARIEVVELDVTDAASVDAAVAHVLATTGGRIDILVNNAGVLCSGPAIEASSAQVQQVFDTNVIGVAHLCRAVAPAMMDHRHGTIVNIGSACGYISLPWASFYSASKAALHAYSDALRMELKPFGVSVVVVVPGYIASNIVTNSCEALFDGDSSRYALARPAMEEYAVVLQGTKAIPAGKFSCVMVPRILTRSPPAYITYGADSEKAWVTYYIPPVIRDYILGRLFGTHQLAKDLQSSLAASNGAVPHSRPAASVVMWVALAMVILGVACAFIRLW
ncbi:hypothetical protein GGF42_000227 [Coemansia sp. RSA 2424]|nr:hypothetical protein GGF42_000227 [Coemansia sp. RSA 2424]